MVESEYLEFREEETVGRKTRVVGVHSKRTGDKLGQIYWYGPWRQYIFSPGRAIFNRGCMQDIIDQIEMMMVERQAYRG